MVPLRTSDLTVPEALELYAREDPLGVLYSYGGDQVITSREFQRAVHRAARELSPGLPKGSVVAFLAVYDILVYEATVVGLMDAGMIPFPLSPRLAPATIVHLLLATAARQLIISKSTLPELAREVEEELQKTASDCSIVIRDIPTLGLLYPRLGQDTDESSEEEPFHISHVSIDDSAIALHSGGTTGMPKPIFQSHRFLANIAGSPLIQQVSEVVGDEVRLAGMHTPPFHTLANFMLLIAPIHNRWDVNLFPPCEGAAPAVTPESVLKAMKLNRTNTLIIVPLFLQYWMDEPESVEYLRTLKLVMYSGAPLAANIGDQLVREGVHIRCLYGATEFRLPTYLISERASNLDWAWVDFVRGLPIRWEEQGSGSGLYECVILHYAEGTLARENLAGGERGYATSDLFEKHPSRKDLWRMAGRKDDLLVHSNGEKTMPSPLENIVKSHAKLRGALMFGHGHDRPGILVDPLPEFFIDVEDDQAVSTFRNEIWPSVSQANDVAPAYSRLFKEMILIASPSKRPIYTIKESIARKPTLDMYQEEIERIYARDGVTSGSRLPENWTKSNIREWIMSEVKGIMGSEAAVTPDHDLFEQGLDSLGATMLYLRLSGGLKNAHHPSSALLTQTIVYIHPSIDGLTSFVLGEAGTLVTVDNLIAKYSQGLDLPLKIPDKPDAEAKSSEELVILLTGSTGSLGAEILFRLLYDKTVATVYAVNRHSSALSSVARQRDRFKDKGFDKSLLSDSRLVFLEGDLSREKIGLMENDYKKVQSSVTVIIHNAWPVDFNFHLASFEGSIKGMRNLIDFGRGCRRNRGASFIFVSSIAAERGFKPSEDLHSEGDDFRLRPAGGYGLSKYVAEKLLEKSSLSSTSLRIDQISGSKHKGTWSLSDWVPIMLKTSLTLGMVPDRPTLVHWVPMDVVAEYILDVACHFSIEKTLPQSLIIRHPHPTRWTDVMNFLRTALLEEGKADLSLVAYTDWIDTLEKRAAEVQDPADKLPAVKLLSFFRAMSPESSLSPVNGVDSMPSLFPSSALKNAKPLAYEDAQLWVKYWLNKGL